MGQILLQPGPTFIQAPQQGRRRARFAETIPNGTRVVYVRQIRSGEHVKPKTRGALRALGLRRIGHTNLLPDTPSTWGNIRQAEHRIEYQVLVYEEDMVFTPADWLAIKAVLDTATDGVVDPLDEDPSPRDEREVGDGVSVKSYEIEIGMSDKLSTPEGDLLWLVRYEQGGSSLTWPTDLSAAEFFNNVLSRVKVSGGLHHLVELYVADDPDPVSIEAGQLLTHQHPSKKAPDVVRLEDEDSRVAFGWQMTTFHGNSAEGGIVAPNGMPLQLLVDLLLETGSGTIPTHSLELAASVVDLDK